MWKAGEDEFIATSVLAFSSRSCCVLLQAIWTGMWFRKVMIWGAPLPCNRTTVCPGILLQSLVVPHGYRKCRKPNKLVYLLRLDKATGKYCFGIIIQTLLKWYVGCFPANDIWNVERMENLLWNTCLYFVIYTKNVFDWFLFLNSK